MHSFREEFRPSSCRTIFSPIIRKILLPSMTCPRLPGHNRQAGGIIAPEKSPIMKLWNEHIPLGRILFFRTFLGCFHSCMVNAV